MIPVLTGKQSRELDAQAISDYHIPSLELMEAAGRGAFEYLESVYPDLKKAKVLIVCGKGNNGGDGLVLARYLKQEWVHTTVASFAAIKELSPDAKTMASRFKKSGGTILTNASLAKIKVLAAHADLIVDALLGTGLTQLLRSPYREIIEIVNEAGKPIFALDIPSGLSADTGKILGTAIRADWTATMGFMKLGLLLPPGCDYCGRIEVIDIGIPTPLQKRLSTPYRLVSEQAIRVLFKERLPESHKGSFGHLLVVAGSPTKLGAALLTCKAALRTGAGLVTLALPNKAFRLLPEHFLEIMYEPVAAAPDGSFSSKAFREIQKLMEGKRAIACGPGIGTSGPTRTLIKNLVKSSPCPLILDADGLNCLADHADILREAISPIVLTPHPGEMASLCHLSPKQVQEERLAIARSFATHHGVTVVLKGYRTVTATPEGKIYLNPTGNPAMATAGMGDVLTGMIASLVTQGIEWVQAITAAVYLHGLAGDRLAERMGDRGLLAGDIVDFIPFLLKDFVVRRRQVAQR